MACADPVTISQAYLLQTYLDSLTVEDARAVIVDLARKNREALRDLAARDAELTAVKADLAGLRATHECMRTARNAALDRERVARDRADDAIADCAAAHAKWQARCATTMRPARHPEAPERCDACTSTTDELLNYGTPGNARWLCHGCATRAITDLTARTEALSAQPARPALTVERLGELLAAAVAQNLAGSHPHTWPYTRIAEFVVLRLDRWALPASPSTPPPAYDAPQLARAIVDAANVENKAGIVCGKCGLPLTWGCAFDEGNTTAQQLIVGFVRRALDALAAAALRGTTMDVIK